MKTETRPSWQVRAVADASELDAVPPALPPAEAQPWCNFVIWTPEALPAGCTLATGTLRRQAPPGRVDGATAGRTPWTDVNPAAYRYEVTGPGRKLRVKQFLYDWTFPALDHPCLWGSPTRVYQICDTYLVWLGTDYMKHPAASARLARTNIELSIVEGEFTDAEIVALYRSMVPAVADAVPLIAATPFAELSYWARYPEATMIHVPIGLYKFRRTGQVYTGRWSAEAGEIAAVLADYRLPRMLAGFEIDSVARFTDDAGRTEAEAIYTAGSDREHELRVLIQRSGQGHLTVPPEPEDHPCTAGVTEVCGVGVSLAWTDEAYGPWDAVWDQSHAGGFQVKLVASAGTPLDRAWFLQAVTEAGTSIGTEPAP